MNKFLFLITAMILLNSCKENREADLANARFCTELLTDSARILTDSALTEKFEITGVAPHASLWWHSINFPISLSVIFLNGTDFQKNKVRQYAKQWSEASQRDFDGNYKIRFRFLPYDGTGGSPDIRVVFRPGGSSAYIGSDAKRVHPDSPTVYFGWINESEPEESIRQVVLHEFGHVMGMIHEHQSPEANIPWDKEKVYEYYRITQSPPWDRPKVDANIFYRYGRASTNYTAYDSLSIMHYAIPSTLTIGGYSTPWNSELSTTDKAFIKKIYRYEPCILNETCCFDRRGRRIPCP